MNSLWETVECSVDEEIDRLLSLYNRIAEAEESFEVSHHWNNYTTGYGRKTGLSTYSKNPQDRRDLVSMYRVMNDEKTCE